MEIVCNIINVFTVTFDQFNASLIHNSFNFFKKAQKSLKKSHITINQTLLSLLRMTHIMAK